jgi:hypothetical protein
MTGLTWPSCTTEVTDGLCVFPCFAVPRSIIRYQRARCSSTIQYLEHELPVQHISTQHNLYIYLLQYGGPSADGGHPGGRRAVGRRDGHTCLWYAMGEGGIRREPQRGGREDLPTKCPFGHNGYVTAVVAGQSVEVEL